MHVLEAGADHVLCPVLRPRLLQSFSFDAWRTRRPLFLIRCCGFVCTVCVTRVVCVEQPCSWFIWISMPLLLSLRRRKLSLAIVGILLVGNSNLQVCSPLASTAAGASLIEVKFTFTFT